MGKERGMLSESTLADRKFYFCFWERKRKGQESGICCKGTLYGGWVREAKVKLDLSKIKLPEMCYYYHCHQQTQDYVESFIKLATFPSFFFKEHFISKDVHNFNYKIHSFIHQFIHSFIQRVTIEYLMDE